MNETPQGPPQEPAQQVVAETRDRSLPLDAGQDVAATGRQVFRDIRRELKEDDLGSPGVQKLLLSSLEQAENERDSLRGYVDLYHAADKRAAVLEEQARVKKSFEVLFTVCIALGGLIIGFVPATWKSAPVGQIALGVGAVLIVGAILARVIKR